MDRIDYTLERDALSASLVPRGHQVLLGGAMHRSAQLPGPPMYEVSVAWSLAFDEHAAVIAILRSGVPILVPLAISEHGPAVDHVCVVDTSSIQFGEIQGDRCTVSAVLYAVSTDDAGYNTTG